MRRLPPLNALRAFEAAARHRSFTKAADELFVTQAAVSHQIKGLETHLGLRLFYRFNRRLELTEAGRSYLPSLSDAFDQIDLATKRLSSQGEDRNLKISVLHSFAIKWLMPRLAGFSERHPEINVLISGSDETIDFDRDDFDLALRYGAGHYPGLATDLIMPDKVFPVCSPRLLKGRKPLKGPGDLRHHTLLHDNMGLGNEMFQEWGHWLNVAGVEGVDHSKGPAFSHLSMVLSAAIDGQGVALGRLSLAAEDLNAGHLICPFGPVIDANYAYYMVAPRRTAEMAKVRNFRQWLLEEAAKTSEKQIVLPGSQPVKAPIA